MTQIVETRIIPIQETKLRLSDLPVGTFKTVSSRKALKKTIKKGLVQINGELAYTADYIMGGESIDILEDPYPKVRAIIEFKLEVLYEDDDLSIVYKPAGMLVSGNKKWTLENALSFNLIKSAKEGALEYPEPIHRLDYATSGLLLVGKTREAIILLNKMFEERQIEKIYHAICIGEMKTTGEIERPIEGKACKSSFKVLASLKSEKYDFLNLVQLTPHTGRRHQLRIHLSEQGNPIFGDVKYGHDGLISRGNGLFLHASSLTFEHPLTKEKLMITAGLPKKFTRLFPNI